MKKHTVLIFIGGVIVLLAAALGGYAYWKSHYRPQSYADCVAHGGALLESYPEQCALHGKTFSNPDQSLNQNPSTQGDLATYTDAAAGYSFQYPKDIFKLNEANRPVPFLNGSGSQKTTVLTHSIPVEYCNLAGKCQPTTTDIEVSFVVADMSLDQIKKLRSFTEIEHWSEALGEHEYIFAEVGAEGEGINYALLALPSNKTLISSHRYINEQILSKYQDEPDFITYSKQGYIVADMLASVQLSTQASTVTSSWKSYTDAAYGFSFRYPPTFRLINGSDYKSSNYDSKQLVGPILEDPKVGSIFPVIFLRPFDPKSIQGIYGKIENPLLVSIGDRTGYLYGEGDGGCAGQSVQTSLGNKTLEMRFVSCEDGSSTVKSPDFGTNPPLIKQILSTFKFNP